MAAGNYYNVVRFVSPTTFISQTATGKASWLNTARLVDTISTNFSTLSTSLAINASTETFTVGGFDFNYLPSVSEIFYGELHLLMASSVTPTVNIGIYSGTTLLYTKSAVCENVNNYKRIALSDILVDIDLIDKADLRLTLRLVNTTGSSITAANAGITSIRLYLRYRDKSLVTSPMGLKLFKANGTSIGDGFSTLIRLVHKQNLPATYSGTFSVPGFDDRRGAIFVSYDLEISTSTTQVAETTNIDSTTFYWFITNSFSLPSLTWNSTTETMTVIPANLPAGFEGGADINPSYTVNFIHFR